MNREPLINPRRTPEQQRRDRALRAAQAEQAMWEPYIITGFCVVAVLAVLLLCTFAAGIMTAMGG